MTHDNNDLRYLGKRHKGTMRLTFNRGLFWQAQTHLFGGPYDRFPGTKDFFGVCVRAENAEDREKDVWLPIHDFEVPPRDLVLDTALRRTLKQLVNPQDRRPVWIGCAGGIGRTGLFMALLAKIAGSASPINNVRSIYNEAAVETEEQFAFVSDFDVTPYVSFVRWEGFKGFLRRTFRF